MIRMEALRPKNLPDFGQPPLIEVVLGIQFDTPAGYQQIYAKNVWDLYKDRFPSVQEMSALPPTFEVFSDRPVNSMNINFHAGATHDRFWFISKDGEQLIQFQNNKILHNWRKRNNPYPRFEEIVLNFENETRALSDFFITDFQEEISINQCEITYVNQLPIDSEFSLSEWFTLFGRDMRIDEGRFVFIEHLRDEEGAKYARLVTSMGSAISEDGAPVIRFDITVRGKPKGTDLMSAINFLREGRIKIVNHFTSITTKSAHKKWGRKE